MDADFLAAIGKTHIVVARNTVTDGGGFDEMDDYFFFLSRSEVYGGAEVSGVNEGAAYPYYSDYSNLATAGTGNDSNRIKYLKGTEPPATQAWWTRTPNSGSGCTARHVFAAGYVLNHYASNSSGVAPACNGI